MTTRILSNYFSEIARIRATRAGTGEISYYGARAGTLNAAGEKLRPRVFCVPNLRNRGSGFPDMGLFLAGRGPTPEEWPTGRLPERVVVEVDDIPVDLSVKTNSEQVRRYLGAYGIALVTNYREFVLLGLDTGGKTEPRERFTFGCADADAFFALERVTTTASTRGLPSSWSVCCRTRRPSPASKSRRPCRHSPSCAAHCRKHSV